MLLYLSLSTPQEFTPNTTYDKDKDAALPPPTRELSLSSFLHFPLSIGPFSFHHLDSSIQYPRTKGTCRLTRAYPTPLRRPSRLALIQGRAALVSTRSRPSRRLAPHPSPLSYTRQEIRCRGKRGEKKEEKSSPRHIFSSHQHLISSSFFSPHLPCSTRLQQERSLSIWPLPPPSHSSTSPSPLPSTSITSRLRPGQSRSLSAAMTSGCMCPTQSASIFLVAPTRNSSSTPTMESATTAVS